jgi:hypothetical protein
MPGSRRRFRLFIFKARLSGKIYFLKGENKMNEMKKCKLSLPLLVPVLGLAFGACAQPNEAENTPDIGKKWDHTAAQCAQWTHESLMRALDARARDCDSKGCQNKQSHLYSTEAEYVYVLQRLGQGEIEIHDNSVGAYSWCVYSPDRDSNSGAMRHYSDADRARAEAAAMVGIN